MNRNYPKYPDVKVKLLGESGDAFSIMAKVSNALREAGYPAEANRYIEEAMNGSYNHMLRVTREYVEVT